MDDRDPQSFIWLLSLSNLLSEIMVLILKRCSTLRVLQIGEQVLADYILCHLDNPRDKFNLLVYSLLPCLITTVYIVLLCLVSSFITAYEVSRTEAEILALYV